MAHTICHSGYCEPIIHRANSSDLKLSSKLLMVGGYIAIILALGAFVVYGVSHGYYPDLTVLS